MDTLKRFRARDHDTDNLIFTNYEVLTEIQAANFKKRNIINFKNRTSSGSVRLQVAIVFNSTIREFIHSTGFIS